MHSCASCLYISPLHYERSKGPKRLSGIWENRGKHCVCVTLSFDRVALAVYFERGINRAFLFIRAPFHSQLASHRFAPFPSRILPTCRAHTTTQPVPYRNFILFYFIYGRRWTFQLVSLFLLYILARTPSGVNFSFVPYGEWKPLFSHVLDPIAVQCQI